MILSRRSVLALTGGAALAAVAPQARAQAAALPVVASFSILGDIVSQVGGPRIGLTTLVPAGGDAHVYRPTPSDARAVSEARVVVINGLQFEGWMTRLIRSSATQATVVEATRGIKARKDPHGGYSHGGHSHGGHNHGGVDPHAWQAVPNVKIYATNVRDALIAADPDGRAVFEERTAAYLRELDQLEAEIRAGVQRIPADRRKVVTAHDAFGYFAEAYGLRFIAPRGVSTEAEPNPQAIARIIQLIKREKVPAIFIESISDPRLIQRIAEETGAKMGGQLFSDSLSLPDGPAPTYIAMMRHNIRTIVGALAPAA
jgi:zinc/manganese transport system substrate-binding protein